jgi:hypothetical protein
VTAGTLTSTNPSEVAPPEGAIAIRVFLQRITEAGTVAALVLGALALWLYMANGRYIGSGDTIPAELLPISVLKEHNLDFNEFSDRHAPQPYYFVVRKERVISFYSIVPGLLNVPVHVAAQKLLGWDTYAMRHKLSKCTAALVTAASVAFLFLVLVKLCQRHRTAFLIAVVYAVCTCAWSVAAQGLWQHGPSLFFLTAALACLVRPERSWLFALGGFCFGMAVFNRPTNLVFALPAAVYVLWQHPRRLAGFLLAAAVPALLMAWYSWEFWGSLLALGQGHRLVAIHGPHATHFHHPLVEGMVGVLFSPGRGLLVFSPVFLFAFPFFLYALWPRAKVRPVYRLMAMGALAYLILFARWSVWWGGYSFGYRMLLEMLPALSLFLALAWERWIGRRWWRRAAFLLAVLVSFYVQILGAWAYPSDWNGRVNIDANPQRNWDWRDSELVALHKKLSW